MQLMASLTAYQGVAGSIPWSDHILSVEFGHENISTHSHPSADSCSAFVS